MTATSQLGLASQLHHESRPDVAKFVMTSTAGLSQSVMVKQQISIVWVLSTLIGSFRVRVTFEYCLDESYSHVRTFCIAEESSPLLRCIVCIDCIFPEQLIIHLFLNKKPNHV